MAAGTGIGRWCASAARSSACWRIRPVPGRERSSCTSPAPLRQRHFASAEPLERLEAHLRLRAPDRIARGVADEAFGRMLTLRGPDGLRIKVLELDRGLIA
ncbi:hypothetical protein [Methylobacterium sp. WSM2598]|uniref:hypothetical protein n=1 Tax=Methylobacterium sp. WSM2598 TaxID=398261 RepID=UPI000152CA07|nr:hypothetical protein [Methylobacterium sp. WSM2598]